jgi:Domain of unknown function (DUF4177)
MQQRWEYKVIQTHDSATHGLVGSATLEEELNELARAGWELFQVVAYSTDRSGTINHYFRREIQGDSPGGPVAEEEDQEDQT